ncbi:MAG: glutamate synthase domain-containing protein 2 [Candidatus Woesearchaeota archaeon]|jgi:glutamate synthase domain-containing protein 2
MSRLSINLHKVSKFTNFSILALLFFFLGYLVSFYFHFLTVAFIFLIGLNYYYLYIQEKHTLLRNFGLMAQIRYLIESVGPEFRQYLYMSDTEERPFNRDERSEVYRKAKNEDPTLSFGSLLDFNETELKLRHSMYPVDKNDLERYSVTFGEERGIEKMYTIRKPFMISAMSFGALGADAVYTARGFMLALGCIQALQCAKNTCPIGITTHDPILQSGLVIEDKAKRVNNYVNQLTIDFYQLLTATGCKNAKELSIKHLYIPQGHTVETVKI